MIFNYLYIHFKILHSHVDSIEKLPLTTTGSPLMIRCKTFLSVTFIIPRERECHNCYQFLLKLSQLGMNCYTFQIHYLHSNQLYFRGHQEFVLFPLQQYRYARQIDWMGFFQHFKRIQANECTEQGMVIVLA